MYIHLLIRWITCRSICYRPFFVPHPLDLVKFEVPVNKTDALLMWNEFRSWQQSHQGFHRSLCLVVILTLDHTLPIYHRPSFYLPFDIGGPGFSGTGELAQDWILFETHSMELCKDFDEWGIHLWALSWSKRWQGGIIKYSPFHVFTNIKLRTNDVHITTINEGSGDGIAQLVEFFGDPVLPVHLVSTVNQVTKWFPSHHILLWWPFHCLD